MKTIRQRPAAAGTRRQCGHWEGDLIIGAGQRSAVATLVERKTRYTMLVLPHGHAAARVADALISAFTALPAGLRRTLTGDQGNEMFQHGRIEEATGLRIYFADPHSPWQRGSNENTNGLLRQYLPKGTDLNSYPGSELRRIAAELNDRPRLCLADRTPASSCDDGTSQEQSRFATTPRNQRNTEGQGRDYPPDWSPGVRRGFPCGQRSDEFRPRQLSVSESQPQSGTFDAMHTTGGDA